MGVLSFLEPVWLKVLPSEKVHPLILSRVTFHRFLTKNKPHPLTSPETPHQCIFLFSPKQLCLLGEPSRKSKCPILGLEPSLTALGPACLLISQRQVKLLLGEKTKPQMPQIQFQKHSRNGAQREPREWSQNGRAGWAPENGNQLLPFSYFPRMVPSSHTDWDAYSCLLDGVPMLISSPKLQQEKTVMQKLKQDSSAFPQSK